MTKQCLRCLIPYQQLQGFFKSKILFINDPLCKYQSLWKETDLSSTALLGSRQTSDFYKQYFDKNTKRHCDNKIKRHFSSNIFLRRVNWKSRFMVLSADFEKQKQYFVKKLLLYRNIACKNCSSAGGLKQGSNFSSLYSFWEMFEKSKDKLLVDCIPCITCM